MRASALLSASLFTLVDASAFLGANPERVSVEQVEQNLLAELAGVFNKRRPLARVEDELRPMYAALPKGPHGNLEGATVRYALHRYFVQQHGWYMKGLEPAGHAWGNLSSDDIAKDKVPGYIQGFFDRRVGQKGLGLHELAIFAATLEDLVQEEAGDSLRAIYHALQLPTVGSSAPEFVGKAVSTHLMLYIVGNVSATWSDGIVVGNFTANSVEGLPAVEEEAVWMYPAWPDIAMWSEDVRRSILYSERHRRNPFQTSGGDFNDATQALAEVIERFGVYQDAECQHLKQGFMEMEVKGTGRLRLTDFWGKGMGGEWQFTESVSYLRELGALDETNPRRPTVIIANYLYSPSNCVASSGFYSVCCRDECEGLLGHLEREVAAPSAEPKQIAHLVSSLSSDTVDAPRNLSSALLSRLANIAAHHGGRVPLHGRLFAQWMHHAYPRECPFPHSAGTTRPQIADEWMERTGQEAFASDEEMAVARARDREFAHASAPEAEADPLPWHTVEELVGIHGGSSHTSALPFAHGIVSAGTLLAALASFGIATARALRASPTATLNKAERMMV